MKPEQAAEAATEQGGYPMVEGRGVRPRLTGDMRE
jgi:hypothetical protein